MATDQEIGAAREAVEKALQTLLAIPIKEAAMRGNLGDINFAVALPAIEKTIGLFGMVQRAGLDYVSHARLVQLKDMVEQAINQFKAIDAFTLNVDNPRAQRDAITDTLQRQYETWFEAVAPIIAFGIRSATDFAALERDLRQKIAQAEVTSKELLQQQESAAAEAQSTLEAIKKAAAQAGVSQEAVHFETEARSHDSSSNFWFRTTAALAVATAAWGAFIVWGIAAPPPGTWEQTLQSTIGKLVVVSGLYYGLVWCARNYNAARHNFVVNRHRANALSTFETFVKAASTDDVKQAVLLQATSSVFAAQPSGYTGKEGEAAQPSNIIEILRSAGSATRPPAS